MSEVDKYLKYLEKIKKENISNNEKKRYYESLIVKVKEMLEVIATNIDQVQEENFKNIFANVDGDNVVKMISEFRNIKIFSKYFNDSRFGQQPQVITAKKRLENIIKQLKTYIDELQKRINDIKFVSEESIKKQINFVKRIKKQERLSSEDLRQFYQKLLECQDKDIDINQIIMLVSRYLIDDLNKQLNARRNVEIKEVQSISQVGVATVEESVEKATQEKNNFSHEELEMIKFYQKKISKIVEIGKKYHVNSWRDLIACYQGKIEVPLTFINEVREVVGIELNLENAKILDNFNDILNLIDDGKIENLQEDDLVEELLGLLKKINDIFKETEPFGEEQNDLLEVLNNPQSLVVFLNDDNDGRSYVEIDFEKEMRNGDRRYTTIAVRNIVKQLYGNSILPSTDGVDKHYCDKSRIYHAKSGREFRCFYIELSVSTEVKEYLSETYGIRKDNMNSFRVYLYTGFVNIENHSANYYDEQYNRCNKVWNKMQVEMLNKFFSKTKLTFEDKIMIKTIIETGFDITKKLNGIERKKRYE